MANKAWKLPSGKYRTIVNIGVDANGKRIRKSITADTKREAERLAALYEKEQDEEPQERSMQIRDAISGYIDAKRMVLSPSTVAGYESLAKTAYDSINDRWVQHIKVVDLQRWVSEYAKTHSPKRVRNAEGLLVAALRMFRPDFSPNLTLPAPIHSDAKTPSTEDVQRLLAFFKDRDRDMYVAVLLAAFCPLRRGEVCGLTGADVDHKNCTITILHNVVQGTNGFVVKQPKTEAGYRTISLPREIMMELPIVAPDEPIVRLKPFTISDRLKRQAAWLGIDIHFHSLRHYGASILHSLGIPDEYVMQRGGWTSSRVMQRVYREALDEEGRKMQSKINDGITAILEHKN